MTRDSSNKLSKREQVKRSNKKVESNLKKKKNQTSDSEDGIGSDSDNEEMDMHEFRKYVQKIFPSKHMDNKIKAGEKLKQFAQDCSEDESVDLKDSSKSKDTTKSNKKSNKKTNKKYKEEESEEEWETSSEEEKPAKKSNYTKKPEKKNKRIEISDDEESITLGSNDTEDDDDYEDTDNYDEEDEEEEEEDDGNRKQTKTGKLNIIFTIGDANDEDEWDTEEDSDYEESIDVTEDEDEEVSSDEEVASDEESSNNEVIHTKKSVKKNKKLEQNICSEKDSNLVLQELKSLLEKNPKDKSIEKCINVYEEDLKREMKQKEKKEKKQKDKNMRIFRKIIRDKNVMNDFLFYEKLDLDNQKKLIKELREINKITRIEKPYRMTLLESDIPLQFKAAAMKKINTLRYMEPGSGEFYKIKNWVDTFMKIPFTSYQELPISIDNGVDSCHEFMENAQKTLDSAVYGLNDAKMQIMQMLGQLLTNPKSIGTAIAIHGPPGTGKCHVYDTPILMFDGTIKMVQDIKVGDIIMGDDSTPRNVLSLGRGEDELYEIIPKKGDKYGVNSEHILCLKPSGISRIQPCQNKNGSISYKAQYMNKISYKIESKRFKKIEEAQSFIDNKNIENEIIEISVKNYLKLPINIQKKLKGYRAGVEFEEKVLPFDPYIIGVWLGDGTSSKPEITNQEAVILHYIKHETKKYNLKLTHYSKYLYGLTYDMYDNDSKNNKNIFLQVLKDLNLLNNKHIPNIYKVNSRYNRLQLLAGIIDTDGSYSSKDKGFDIIQKNETLTNDIIFLARSLGYAAYKSECNKSCLYKGNKVEAKYYRLFISGNNLDEIPTKCPRKRAETRTQIKDPLKTGITVKSIGRGNYYGFTLDNNHRYLLGDFAVTHNTSLVKEGISKILNRPFAFIALGGATDSSFLEGHGYTYEGSTWGKIVQILIDSKCMNPVIYFDELDKISDTPRGEEIAGILTHLTDTTQNSQFHDKYFAEINFDLSKCLFIFSYNDESKVNPILKDRMYRIKTKGYSSKEKTVIANNYLLPKIREQVKFNDNDIIIPDDVLNYINETHCQKEDGVRNMKRCLEIIYTKLNLYRLMKPGSNLFENEMSLKVEFPFKITKDIVDKLIKKEQENISALYSMYV
jgi:hypothetical protein